MFTLCPRQSNRKASFGLRKSLKPTPKSPTNLVSAARFAFPPLHVESRSETHAADAAPQERHEPAVAERDLHVRLGGGHVHPSDFADSAEELPPPGDEVGALPSEVALDGPVRREAVGHTQAIGGGVVAGHG